MYKAIFFDIDGTLISFDTHDIPKSTREALNILREKGIKLFLATGRSPLIMDKVFEIIDFEFDGYVFTNGQHVIYKNEIIRDNVIDSKGLEKLIPYIKEHSIAVEFTESDYRYINLINDRVVELKKLLGVTGFNPKIDDPERSLDKKVYQLAAYITEDEEEDFFKNAPHMRSVRWNPLFADVIPKSGGKEVGIYTILEKINVDISECIAFGDGGNDTDMISHAGLGIAMGNAVDEAKEVADYVTDSVDNDGIYKALKHFDII